MAAMASGANTSEASTLEGPATVVGASDEPSPQRSLRDQIERELFWKVECNCHSLCHVPILGGGPECCDC